MGKAPSAQAAVRVLLSEGQARQSRAGARRARLAWGRRRQQASLRGVRRTLWARTWMAPPIVLSSVLLPAPFGPSTSTRCPFWITALTPGWVGVGVGGG